MGAAPGSTIGLGRELFDSIGGRNLFEDSCGSGGFIAGDSIVSPSGRIHSGMFSCVPAGWGCELKLVGSDASDCIQRGLSISGARTRFVEGCDSILGGYVSSVGFIHIAGS